MTRILLLLGSLTVVWTATAQIRASDIDPFIGTGGHGHTHPAATAPFGMLQIGPDTRREGWDGCSGYHYTDTTVWGFSHTHLSGTGVGDYGDFLFKVRLRQIWTLVKIQNALIKLHACLCASRS